MGHKGFYTCFMIFCGNESWHLIGYQYIHMASFYVVTVFDCKTVVFFVLVHGNTQSLSEASVK